MQGKGHWKQVSVQKTRLAMPKVKQRMAWQQRKVRSRQTAAVPGDNTVTVTVPGDTKVTVTVPGV